ncbi:MAG: myxococcus cysteine-rich repeat containing protein, partial [Candidatus Peribacteraceae bacterium]|nr:myxococcus cysteine-rich repeat containing protein [Candidatus Peribacteraceae bacterium]
VCGNGILETGEQCDDGNPLPGDGCSAACFVELMVASSSSESSASSDSSASLLSSSASSVLPMPAAETSSGSSWLLYALLIPVIFVAGISVALLAMKFLAKKDE